MGRQSDTGCWQSPPGRYRGGLHDAAIVSTRNVALTATILSVLGRFIGDRPERRRILIPAWPRLKSPALEPKIEAVINNARQTRKLVKQEGSLAAFIWRYEPGKKQLAKPQTASTSAESLALSKDLKKQGWKFVGPTTVYAFMQAMGLINDHVEDCVIRAKVERARKKFRRPGR